MRTLRNLLAIPLILVAAGCAATLDRERSILEDALLESRTLATEIATWRQSVPTEVSDDVAETMEGFKTRADDILDTINAISYAASKDVDLAGVRQALTSVAQFDTSRFPSATPSARRAILDQLRNTAVSVDSATDRAMRAMD